MKVFSKYITALLLLTFGFSSCVTIHKKYADEYYGAWQYQKAIQEYEVYLDRYRDYEAMLNLADCYRITGKDEQAEKWYRIVSANKVLNPSVQIGFAMVLMRNEKYKEAKKWLEQYLLYNRNDSRTQNLIEACDSLQQFFVDSSRIEIKSLKLNKSGIANYAPAFFRSGIVFASERGSNANKNSDYSEYTGKRTTDLFYAKRTEAGNWMEPEPLMGQINNNHDEGPVVFNRFYNTIYFTRCNTDKTNVIQSNDKNISVLKIYKGYLEGNNWKFGIEMPFNSNDYSVMHPAISEDGNTLYFASDMPWGYGGTDLYRSQQINGRWSQPINLGPKINTPGNELFPFMYNDSILYFASNGWPGLGGLDIYESFYTVNDWTTPRNIGFPINSSKDDFAIIVDSTGQSGFFTSNRLEYSDKIFEFNRFNPTHTLFGILLDRMTNKPIVGLSLTLKSSNQSDKTVFTDEKGKFSATLESDKDYDLIIKDPIYYYTKASFSTKGKRYAEKFDASMSIDRIQLDVPSKWYAIKFDKRSAEINQAIQKELEKVIKLLSDNPQIKIELSMHTDSRGNDRDNFLLSQKRAETIKDYLVLRGIFHKRITAIGYGESRLLNHCKNGIMCLEEEHAENERCEIKVISITP
ncbi:MAG TPA: OmpA family protein [Bacteroidia bacterium]|nr:OmpA family protein [Bacteroidia bacterium]HNT80663.1 OmpA family protein [Bacteroidia bacterium]